jgi:hypothetical protein
VMSYSGSGPLKVELDRIRLPSLSAAVPVFIAPGSSSGIEVSPQIRSGSRDVRRAPPSKLAACSAQHWEPPARDGLSSRWCVLGRRRSVEHPQHSAWVQNPLRYRVLCA